MVRTVIYGIYLLALIAATFLFVIKTDNLWKAQNHIRARLLKCEDEEERAKHKYAFNNVTVEALSWTAITIGGIYACFDCLVSLLNTL